MKTPREKGESIICNITLLDGKRWGFEIELVITQSTGDGVIMVSRELEWFDIETKMREVLYSQLVPVIQKAREDREEHCATKSLCGRLENRVKKLETFVFGGRDEDTVISDLYNICATIEGNRKKDNVRLDQEKTFTEAKIASLSFSINDISELCKNLHRENKDLESKTVTIKEIIESNKNLVLLEMDKVVSNFKELNKSYVTTSLKIEEKALSALDKITLIQSEIGLFQGEKEILWKSYNESVSLIKELRATKLSIDDFNSELEKISSNFKDVHKGFMAVEDKLQSRDLFTDKYLPMKISYIISDYLHFTLDKRYTPRIAAYENMLLPQLNREILSNLVEPMESQVKKILKEMQRIEERKSKIAVIIPSIDPQKTPLQSPDKVKLTGAEGRNLSLSPQRTMYLHSATLDSPREEASEASISRFMNEVSKTKEDFQCKIDALTLHHKSSNDQNNIIIKQILSELSDMARTRQSDSKDIQKNFTKIKAMAQENKLSIASHEELLGKITRMIVCLVENAQIQQALEAQDEEDRHLIAKQVDRDLQNEVVLAKASDQYVSSVPSASFAVKKNCLSCGTATSMLSGMRTSVVYHPTPLIYREKLYQRPELIAIKGRMVKTCWDSAQLPWKQDDIEPLFTQASRNSQMAHRRDSDRFDMDDFREIPTMNLSSLRNRRRSRFKIRNSVKSTDKY